jgi:alkylhydroperoxidase family enzyme
MARIHYVNDEIYQQILGSEQVANILRVIFHAPVWAEEFVKLATVQMTQLKLAPALRELVILHSSRLYNAEYIWAQHQGISQAIGVSEEQRKALLHGNLLSEVFSERESALLQFISSVAKSQALSAEEFARTRQHFSEQELVEAIGVHGFAYTVAKLTSAFEVEVDPIDGSKMLAFIDEVESKLAEPS